MATNKALGQHWLYNRAILDEIARLAAWANDEELCVEIGPGLGTLTSSLFKYYKRIIAVEYDKKLADNLPKSFPGKDLIVINGDILSFDFSKIQEQYAVAIIEKLLTAKKLPMRIVLLMQKEVAERITSEKESVLSLFVKNRATAKLGPVVKAEEFTPPPKVDSQVLILEPHQGGPIFDDKIFKTIKMGFRAPRKKLIHNLAGLKDKEELIKIFEKLDISLDARPADLSLNKWYGLYNEIY